jgi:dTDP-4-amino-4,6-dideoxygalactose transaminase
MSQTNIPVLDLKPQYESLKSEIQVAISRVLESGQFIMGPDVKQFEQEVAEYLGVRHAIAVNSGTDALVIGLKALGIGEGDEVITTPFSFFATAESISSVGAKPIFVDINPDSFNIDPTAIAARITPQTKAIMPVHLYGNPAAMAAIMDIAQTYNLKVIEDCAQSFGARYYGTCSACDHQCEDSTRTQIAGKHTGTIGNVGAYSFFPSKNLGAYGDGGLIVTNDDQVAEIARMLRVHGAKKKYHNEVLGYNSRLDTMQAAILRVKLPHIDSWNEGRRLVAKSYNQLLADVSGVVAPEFADGHVFHQYTIRITNSDRQDTQQLLTRDSVHQYLAAQGIGTMVYYPVPQDQLPVYKGKYPVNPVSDLLASQVLSLPIWPELNYETIERVGETIRQALALEAKNA